jgi:hypothetical protein
MAPVTSMSANRIYGALSTAGELMQANPGKVTFIVDAPQPESIAAGARAILNHPDNLTKLFYSYRKEYELAVRDRKRLLGIIERLHTQDWPTTIVPALPWHNRVKGPTTQLPYRTTRTVSLNLDSYLFGLYPAQTRTKREDVWSTEGRVTQPISFAQRPIPRRGFPAYDNAVLQQLADSTGTLIEVPKTGTWWNTRYAQSLVAGTPVFSDWRETSALGNAWSVLPMNIETMSDSTRDTIAAEQLDRYRDACGTQEDADEQLFSIIRLTRARSKV